MSFIKTPLMDFEEALTVFETTTGVTVPADLAQALGAIVVEGPTK